MISLSPNVFSLLVRCPLSSRFEYNYYSLQTFQKQTQSKLLPVIHCLARKFRMKINFVFIKCHVYFNNIYVKFKSSKNIIKSAEIFLLYGNQQKSGLSVTVIIMCRLKELVVYWFSSSTVDGHFQE